MTAMAFGRYHVRMATAKDGETKRKKEWLASSARRRRRRRCTSEDKTKRLTVRKTGNNEQGLKGSSAQSEEVDKERTGAKNVESAEAGWPEIRSRARELAAD